MSTVRAYYNGSAFVPVEPVYTPRGEFVILSILHEDSMNSATVKKLADFRQLTREIHELNKTDPLTPEFDEILNTRVNIARDI
jgi:hypothetical protein